MQSNILKFPAFLKTFFTLSKLAEKQTFKKIQKSKVPNEIFGFMIREPLELGVPES